MAGNSNSFMQQLPERESIKKIMEQLPAHIRQFLSTMTNPGVEYEQTLNIPQSIAAGDYNFTIPWVLFGWNPDAVIHSPELMFQRYNNNNVAIPPGSVWEAFMKSGNWKFPSPNPDFSTPGARAIFKTHRNSFMQRINSIFAGLLGLQPDQATRADSCYKLMMRYTDTAPGTVLPAGANAQDWWVQIPVSGPHYLSVKAIGPSADDPLLHFRFLYNRGFYPFKNCIAVKTVRLPDHVVAWLNSIAAGSGYLPAAESNVIIENSNDTVTADAAGSGHEVFQSDDDSSPNPRNR